MIPYFHYTIFYYQEIAYLVNLITHKFFDRIAFREKRTVFLLENNGGNLEKPG